MEWLPKLYPFCGLELLLGIFKELMRWPSHNQPKKAQQVDKPTATTPLELWPQRCAPKQLTIRTTKWLLEFGSPKLELGSPKKHLYFKISCRGVGLGGVALSCPSEASQKPESSEVY